MAPRKTSGLTERQAAVLNYIIDYTNRCGASPSMREIGDHLGINSSHGVYCHIKTLEKKGYIRRGAKGRSRAIDVLKDANDNLMRMSLRPAALVDAQGAMMCLVRRCLNGQVDADDFEARAQQLLDQVDAIVM